MTVPAADGIRVVVTDLLTGDTQEAVIPPGDYLLLTVAPCHVAGTQVYGNGTHVVTIKGRTT